MLRLKSPNQNRFFQAQVFESSFGGGEANVAVSLSTFGHKTSFVTLLPDNKIGDACMKELRAQGVSTSLIKTTRGRMGIYFLEVGANQRPSKVIYDRVDSAMSLSKQGDFNWNKIFQESDWFHVSGITPAICQSAADHTLEAIIKAKKIGLTTSFDLNYRRKLWNYGKKPSDVMQEIFRHVDIGIAGREDCQKCLNIHPHDTSTNDDLDMAVYEDLTSRVMTAYPNLKMIAITLRQSHNANHNNWSACLRSKENFYQSQQYSIPNIVDRVGAGDSFSAGLLHGLSHMVSLQHALNFATAASCLKHSIHGDFNQVSIAEVENLLSSDGSVRVQR